MSHNPVANGAATISSTDSPHHNGTSETTPLLPSHSNHTNDPIKSDSSELTLSHRLYHHLTRPLRRQYADLILLSCYFITGLLDASSIHIWGAFVSMQTGNTVYLGLGIVTPATNTRWLKSLTSITFFCLGSFTFARLHRGLGEKKRFVFVLSYTVQTLMILGAAIMVATGSSEDGEADGGKSWRILVPLAMLAFQSSGQAVTSRVLKFNGLPSVVLTSTYCDLFSDPKVFVLTNLGGNAERNRRVVAVVLLLAGAVVGGVFANSGAGMAAALWTAVGLKCVVVAAWLVWWEEKED